MLEVYNYLIEGYLQSRDFNYRTGKRNELKSIYDSITSMNKRSPLYKINLSRENQQYTLGIKEAAMALEDKLLTMSDPCNEAFHKKTVSVSGDGVLSASLLKGDIDSLPKDIMVTVKALAARQLNRGRELYNFSKAFEKGDYEFSAKIMGQTNQFTFVQEERLENRDTMRNMARFINESVPGIVAAVEKADKPDYSRLVITSERTGKVGTYNFYFDDDELYKDGVVDFFGMNRVDKEPANAEFELNGIKKQTSTNTFNIENAIQVTLRDTSEEPVSLTIIPDKDTILKSVDSFIQTFNSLIQLAKERTEEMPEHYGPAKLINEIKNLEEAYRGELEANGFSFSEYGMLSLDDSLAVQASEDGSMESLFTDKKGFIARLLDKTEAIAINPIEYLDKKVLLYPNSDSPAFTNPYLASRYSGLLFNFYC